MNVTNTNLDISYRLQNLTVAKMGNFNVAINYHFIN